VASYLSFQVSQHNFIGIAGGIASTGYQAALCNHPHFWGFPADAVGSEKGATSARFLGNLAGATHYA